MKSVWLSVATLLLLAVSQAQAGKIAVPGDFDTIQAAVDAATAGDVILVSGGPFVEDVAIIDKRDLTLQGKGAPVVRSFFLLRASSVTLTGLAVEGSESHGLLLVDSTDLVVRKCAVRDTVEEGIRTESCSKVVIDRNRLERIGRTGIMLSPPGGEPTDDSIVTRNVIRDVDAEAVFVNGSGNRIEHNDASGADRGFVVEDGTDNRVRKNRASATSDDGFAVHADGNTIERNTASDIGDDAYEVEFCSGNRFVRNKAFDVDETGFQIYEASENRIEKNLIRRSGEQSIALYSGTGNELVKNRLFDAAREGISVEDSANSFLKNKVKASNHHGIAIYEGSGNVFTKNVVTAAGSNGFDVESSGNTFVRNKARKSADYDLEDSAGGNTYEKNKFKSESVVP